MSSRASTWISLGGYGLAALLFAAGCEGSSGTTRADGGLRPEAGGNSDVLPGPNTGNRDGAGTIEVRTPPPPPEINKASIKVMPAGTNLLGGITVGCTYGDASKAANARWCAFARPGTTLSRMELWMMNMSKITTTAPKCDGSNPDCVRLTDNLFSGSPQVGPRFPSAHRFYGDTFIYHANATSSPSATYQGPIFAWKPGMMAPKQISGTNNAFRCVGHARADVAICLENLRAVEGEPLTFDLYAGKIDGTNAVKMIAKVYPSHPETQASQWGAGFTADGKYFLYSMAKPAEGATAAQPETLYYIETDKIGAEPAKQAGDPGVSSWDISPDYTKWFFLKDYNYSDTAPSGTLYMADFPTGANPKKLTSTLVQGGGLTGIAGYDVVPTKDMKLGFVAAMQEFMNGRGEYRIIKDPNGNLDDAANVLKIDDIGTIPANSADLRYAWYFQGRNMSVPGITDARLMKNDGGSVCALNTNTTSSIFGTPFLENAGLAFWIENYDQDSDSGDGWVAKPADCTGMTLESGKKRKFGSKVDFWFVKGDEQLVYSDDVIDVTSTLRVAKVTGGELGTGEVIQKQIERFFQLLPGQEAVLYRILSSSESADGIYYYKVGATPPATTDGGTPPAPDAGGATQDAGAGDAAPKG